MTARKKLIEILEEKNHKSRRSREYVSSFLAEKKEIQEALNGYWPILQIWKVLVEEQRIRMPYPTFCRYVKSNLESPKKERGLGGKGSRTRKKEGTFVHNPIPNGKDVF
jgi:hypothetical protein